MPGNKSFYFIILFLFFTSSYSSNQHPLSKINIKSQRSICKKDQTDKNLFDLTYFDNVVVKLADGTQITSDELKINLDGTQFKKSLEESQQEIAKKIEFKSNVKFVKKNKTVIADKAEIFVDKKECWFLGNVKIEQRKQSSKDIPITTLCSKAIINLENEELKLEGNRQKPVNTILAISEKLNLFKNKKSKSKS